MLHSPDNCNEVDCQECQDLVDAGLIYGCDFCGKTLHSCEFNHVYDEKSGVHKCLNCVEEEIKELMSKCYNQLVAEYLSCPDDEKVMFLHLLERLQHANTSITPGKSESDLEQRLCYSRDVLVKSLKKLIEVFDIRYTTVKITFNNGSIYSSNIIYPNSTLITSVS